MGKRVASGETKERSQNAKRLKLQENNLGQRQPDGEVKSARDVRELLSFHQENSPRLRLSRESPVLSLSYSAKYPRPSAVSFVSGESPIRSSSE